MPRAKTIQPEPLETIIFKDDDGNQITIEIRDENTRIISRGSHKIDEYEKRKDAILEFVVKDYLTPSGKKKISTSKDYLSSPTKFQTKMEYEGFGDTDGRDSNSLRKKMYKEVKQFVIACENAINIKLNSLK